MNKNASILSAATIALAAWVVFLPVQAVEARSRKPEQSSTGRVSVIEALRRVG